MNRISTHQIMSFLAVMTHFTATKIFAENLVQLKLDIWLQEKANSGKETRSCSLLRSTQLM